MHEKPEDAGAQVMKKWTGCNGRIVLRMTRQQAEKAYLNGQTEAEIDADLKALSEDGAIRPQLDAISPDVLRDELRQWGMWSEAELADVEQNYQHLLWVAAIAIHEGECE
jgi:hypothetical protein